MERTAGERDFDLAVLADVVDAILEQAGDVGGIGGGGDGDDGPGIRNLHRGGQDGGAAEANSGCQGRRGARSEEHTSELQSHSDLVCRLLLEKKKSQDQLPPTVLTVMKEYHSP